MSELSSWSLDRRARPRGIRSRTRFGTAEVHRVVARQGSSSSGWCKCDVGECASVVPCPVGMGNSRGQRTSHWKRVELLSLRVAPIGREKVAVTASNRAVSPSRDSSRSGLPNAPRSPAAGRSSTASRSGTRPRLPAPVSCSCRWPVRSGPCAGGGVRSAWRTVRVVTGLAYPDAILTLHAQSQMQRRGVTEDDVRAVLTAPEQVLEVRPNRLVLQSRVQLGSTARLIRVFIDVDRVPAEVVTVYSTSRVAKYWEA